MSSGRRRRWRTLALCALLIGLAVVVWAALRGDSLHSRHLRFGWSSAWHAGISEFQQIDTSQGVSRVIREGTSYQFGPLLIHFEVDHSSESR